MLLDYHCREVFVFAYWTALNTDAGTHTCAHARTRRQGKIMLICWPITSGVESSLGLENLTVMRKKKKQNEQQHVIRNEQQQHEKKKKEYSGALAN